MPAKVQPDQHAQDNVVNYEIYLTSAAKAAELEELRVLYTQTLLPYTTGYIWQDACFSLQSSSHASPPWEAKANSRPAKQGPGSPVGLAKLWGSACFGDNIEDEWFIVWLLLQLTTKFGDIAARVWDNDGDFLLIEAAYSLPKWLKPEVSNNRVWLHQGQLHIVPLPSKRVPALPPSPSLPEAIQIITSEAITTQANAGMQNAIQGRIKGYPQKALAEMHRARCLLPAKVARILKQQPQLVSPAVQTFYYRDVGDMKAAARLKAFPSEEMMTVLVTFNRALYAQLAQQHFQAPRGYAMPPTNSPAWKSAELGMKLTCGFEMVLARHSTGDSGSSPGNADATKHQPPSMEQLKDNSQWASYKASLDKHGYFQANVPGSAQHKQLLAQAVQSFAQSEAYRQSAAAAAAPADAITAILSQPADPQEFQGQPCGPEDDDSWMTGGAADLEAELAQRQKELEADVAKHAKRTAEGLSDAGPSTTDFDPTEVVSKMKAFVDQVSSHEGAELPDDVNGVSFSDPAFWRELSSALGIANDQSTGLEAASEASSDFSDPFDDKPDSDDDDNDSDDKPESSNQDYGSDSRVDSGNGHAQHLPLMSQHAADIVTDTDSDDEDFDDQDTDGFRQAYDEVLSQQIADSRVGNLLQPGMARPAAEQEEHGPLPVGASASRAKGAHEDSEELQPVDLDTNMVQNLLQSYAAQEGLAGPAGNLAGLLGLKLPDNVE